MRTILVLGIAGCMLLGAGVAMAQSRPPSSTYDNRSGNSYNTWGGTTRGYNQGTGSAWSSQGYSGGQRGTDSQGNPWSYNSRTGVYQNYGTGRTCVGSGAGRVCY